MLNAALDIVGYIGEKNRSVGVSAQHVQKVLPEAVIIDKDLMGVDYTQSVPLLMEEMKKQRSEIDR